MVIKEAVIFEKNSRAAPSGFAPMANALQGEHVVHQDARAMPSPWSA